MGGYLSGAARPVGSLVILKSRSNDARNQNSQWSLIHILVLCILRGSNQQMFVHVSVAVAFLEEMKMSTTFVRPDRYGRWPILLGVEREPVLRGVSSPGFVVIASILLVYVLMSSCVVLVLRI